MADCDDLIGNYVLNDIYNTFMQFATLGVEYPVKGCSLTYLTGGSHPCWRIHISYLSGSPPFRLVADPTYNNTIPAGAGAVNNPTFGDPATYGGTVHGTVLCCKNTPDNTSYTCANDAVSYDITITPPSSPPSLEVTGISSGGGNGGGQTAGGGGDPHFLGLDNVIFDFHGQHNKAYNLIQDDSVRVNALFTKFKDDLTYMTEMAFVFNNKSNVIFFSNGSIKTHGRSSIVSRITDPKEAAKRDMIAKRLEPYFPTVLDVTEIVHHPWWFMVSRMELWGTKFLNVACRLKKSCCRRKPSGIIGQTSKSVFLRKPNESFEVPNLLSPPISLL
jgi:hypothetical protein